MDNFDFEDELDALLKFVVKYNRFPYYNEKIPMPGYNGYPCVPAHFVEELRDLVSPESADWLDRYPIATKQKIKNNWQKMNEIAQENLGTRLRRFASKFLPYDCKEL